MLLRHRSVFAALATAFAAVSLAQAPSASAQADAGSISVSLQPTQVSLAVGESTQGVLLVSNGGAEAVGSVHVEVVESESWFDVRLPVATVAVDAHGSSALKFTVTRAREGTGAEGTAMFVVTYTQAARKTAVERTLLATLDVKGIGNPAVVEAKIESNTQTINENRPGEAALVISNPRETEMRVSSIQVDAPSEVKVRLDCTNRRQLIAPEGRRTKFLKCPLTVAPRSQQVLHMTMETSDSVAPGPRSLLVAVLASGGDSTPQSVVATTTFTVDVFAEDDILKAIGVPVFLLLPGVVIVLTAWFLIAKLSPWRRLAGGHSPEGVISQATMVAVFGLAVSLGVAALYPFLTRTIYPGQERDYLKAYGFRDFYYVFGYSFAIAVVCWVIAFLLYLLAPAFCWLFVPEPGDDQSALVRKIGLRGMFGGRSNFPRVTSGAQGALRLAERSGGKTLVAPAVLVDLDAGTPAKAKAKEDIAKAANGDHPFRLWRRTRHAKRKEGAELVWLPGDIPAPSLADGSTLTGNAQPSPIVRTQ